MLKESTYEVAGSKHFIQVKSNRFEAGHFHLHVNIATPAYFEDSPPDGSKDAGVEQVLQSMQRFVTHVAMQVESIGRCSVEKGAMPVDSWAMSLSGLKTSISNEVLTLSGANMVFSGDDFERLQWDDKGSRLVGRLNSVATDQKLTTSFLRKSLNKIDKGMRRFLIGGGGE